LIALNCLGFGLQLGNLALLQAALLPQLFDVFAGLVHFVYYWLTK